MINFLRKRRETGEEKLAYRLTAGTTTSRSRRLAALTTASSLALLALVAHPAHAQTAPEPAKPAEATPPAAEEEAPVEVVVVTGFRRSLQNAQSIKRSLDTVVDVVTAEDIGALPDRSVAEALQRIPGINISRFEQRNDPDRFSVEGSGVIIRGLPYVRSELNGCDIFSANGGRELSFNDVSPELLGRVEVFKNATADMIDGGISGTVNLVTRKPFDKKGPRFAGTIESNYGDMAKKWSPGFSFLASNTYETEVGNFGLQLAYAQSQLVTKTDASQITDPCYRDASLTSACIRVRPVGSGGFSGSQAFTSANFPPANAVFVPKGAGVRTTDLTRDRDAISVVGQWESNDKRWLATLEYLKATTEATLEEYSALALVNDDGLFPVVAPGTTPTFSGNQFVRGTLTQVQPFTGGRGIPTELLRFQREDAASTEDVSLSVKFNPSDRWRFNFEAQYIGSDRTENGFISAMQTYTDVFIDNTGDTPLVQFLQPGSANSPASYFKDPSKTFYWFLLDNQVYNEGEMTSVRLDSEYDLKEDGFFKGVRFGARWADRSRITRNANFSNWGNLGAPWTGRGGNWNCGDFQAFGCGGAYVKDFPGSSAIRNPFGNNFQRGNVPVPFGDGSAFFFGSDNTVRDYLSGEIRKQAAAITAYTLTPNAWFPISARNNNVTGGPWTPGEISDVEELTSSAFARVDFGKEFSSDLKVTGNFGLRYVETTVQSGGSIQMPTGEFFDNPNIVNGVNIGGNGDGIVSVAELQRACSNVQAGQIAPGYCSLSSTRLAEFASFFTGEKIDDSADIKFDHVLPSFNAKADFGNGMLVRMAISKGISRPDLNAFATGGGISDNTANLKAGGTLATGPLFQIGTGNRLLRPIESWNYDLSYEWYFAKVGYVSVSAFMKDIKGIVNGGASVRRFTSPKGVSGDILVNGPVNSDGGILKGVEISYQQTYDFLPGLLSGLGAQFTYTYVDAGDFSNSNLGAEQSPFAGSTPLAGVSEHTINAVGFYERGPIAMRLAYNWRSEFLQTPRDVIFPFSPIYGEETGQLDGSIFYTWSPRVKFGIQGVNLLDEVTQTSQVIDFKGTRVTRSAFRNDRRFTVMARVEF
ncbi:vitamin B12 transporter BtuB [Candidatus Phycosocius bacilliformis]|uniref:Vitamin B12 transporter BtuB n=1 Tax=Candidatus Phycosocius bacilliformis TaxID=1445552 RepID=A0A2P2EA52_9PROT|nr:vitamin B12 transporter BtuB [Candidatus Phycosocius bacilliformis]